MQTQDHYGNPIIEQRKLFVGEAVCLLEPKGIITIEGADRLTWLHSLLSQNLKNLNPGDSTEALLLDPQGHIEQQIKVIEDGQATWLMVPGTKKQALLDWLNKMIFRMKVTITDRSEEFVIVGSIKLFSGLAERSNSQELVWKDNWANLSPGGYRYSKRETEYSWYEHLVEASKIGDVLAGKELAGTMASEALRVAASRPSIEFEVDEKSLPHELDLLSTAVHLSKGCYRGQETVAKVHNLGHPPRRLTFLHLDGLDVGLPELGTEVYVQGEEKAKGKITSVAQHFEMGPIALAVLNRSVPENAILEVRTEGGIISATQEIVVPQSAGAVADLPKPSRLNLSSRPK